MIRGGQQGLYRIEVDNGRLRILLDKAALKLDATELAHVGLAVRDLAAVVQARAVRNVSGYPVLYDGRAFRVRVRTGALKGSIEHEWPYQSQLQARVYVNGAHTSEPMQIGEQVVKPRPVSSYAAAIEFGHGPIDLKKTMLGKTVPFFAARSANATGPYAATGLKAVDEHKEWWQSEKLNAKLAAKGKRPMYFQRREAKAYASGGGATYFIAFRRVGKTGWVIPEAKPRPFMRAATKQSQQDAATLTRQRLREVLSNAPLAG